DRERGAFAAKAPAAAVPRPVTLRLRVLGGLRQCAAAVRQPPAPPTTSFLPAAIRSIAAHRLARGTAVTRDAAGPRRPRCRPFPPHDAPVPAALPTRVAYTTALAH